MNCSRCRAPGICVCSDRIAYSKPHIRMEGGCWVVEVYECESEPVIKCRTLLCGVYMTFDGAASRAWSIWMMRDASGVYRHGGLVSCISCVA
jgi:hypothetical protein